jgi:hypothetical protein
MVSCEILVGTPCLGRSRRESLKQFKKTNNKPKQKMTTSKRPWSLNPHKTKQILDFNGVVVALFEDERDAELCVDRVNGVGERIEKVREKINEIADDLEDLCSEEI